GANCSPSGRTEDLRDSREVSRKGPRKEQSPAGAAIVLSFQRIILNSDDADDKTRCNTVSNALALAAIAGGAILTWVLFLYRKGRLKEDHALLWIAVAVSVILLSTWTELLATINQVVGAARSSDVVLASFVAFLLIVSIYYSVRISGLEWQNKKIAQEIAIMKLTGNSPLSTEQRKES